MVPRNSTPGGFAYIWQSKWVGIMAIKTERTQIHFLSDVFVAVASLDLKIPNIRTHADIVRLRLPCSPSLLPVLSLYADDTSAIVSTDSAIRKQLRYLQFLWEGFGLAAFKSFYVRGRVVWGVAWSYRLAGLLILFGRSRRSRFSGFIGNGDLSELNWRPRIDAVQKCFNSWRHRSLSYGGRALVSNALTLSFIWYAASLVSTPSWALRELNTAFSGEVRRIWALLMLWFIIVRMVVFSWFRSHLWQSLSPPCKVDQASVCFSWFLCWPSVVTTVLA